MTVDRNKKVSKISKSSQVWWKRGLRIVGRIVLAIFVLFIFLILFVRSPWGQSMIVGKLTDYISKKTKTHVSIDKLFITFLGEIDLQGLYVEDTAGDTLIYSEKLKVSIPIWPIITGNPISIDGLEWSGLRANVVRRDSTHGFNFQFLIDAFASEPPVTTSDTSNSKPPEIFIGSIALADFKINFEDDVNGMKANLNLGQLNFEGKDLDLEKIKFQVKEISLENTIIKYVQTKASSPSADTTKSVLPFLSLDDLNLKSVSLHYTSVPDGIDADVHLAELHLQLPKADLGNHDIQIDQFVLNNSNIQVLLKHQNDTIKHPEVILDSLENKAIFIWPDWNVNIESIGLVNNHFHFQTGDTSNSVTGFNPKYIVLNDFNFKAKEIALLKNNSANIQLEDLSFNESSGIVLNQLAFSAKLDATSFLADDFIVKLGNSHFNADLKAEFTSLQQLIDQPDLADLTLNLKEFAVDMNDAFKFQPELRKNEYLNKLAINPFSGNIVAKGTLSNLNLSSFLVNWGENTAITTQGTFKNLTDFDRFLADINNITFNSTRSDIILFVSEKDLGITIPKNLMLQSQFTGSLNDFHTKTQLILPEGLVKIDAYFKQQNEIAFSATINVLDLNIGKIINNPEIGSVNFEMIAAGKGNNINDLNASLISEFSKLELNGYDFSALQLDGELIAGDGTLTIKYKDENLDLLVDSKIQLDSVSPKIALDFNLNGADLFALGFSDQHIKTKLLMKADFEGNADKFNFESHISEGLAVKGENTYSLGTVDLIASVSSDTSSMDIRSNFLNGNLRANAGIDQTTAAIKQHLNSYFSDSIVHFDSIHKPVKLQMDMQLSDSKLLSEFLVPNIKALDTVALKIDFDQEAKDLTVNFNMPFLDYANNTIDSLQLIVDATEKLANFKFGFKALNAGPVVMQRTYLDGDLKDRILKLNFNSFEREKELYVVRTEISGESKDLKIHLDPEKLIFQEKVWSIPVDNQIRMLDKSILAQNFVLSRNEQSFTIANDLIKTSENNIGIGFNSFKLSNFLALLNKNELVASGDLNGNIVIINPLEKIGLNANFSIDSLTALKAPLGKLSLNAESKSSDHYNLDLEMKGDDVDFDLKGDYAAEDLGAKLEFNFKLNKLGMETIATLSCKTLRDASGYISGEIALDGDVKAPQYDGYLQFNDAVFNVSELNSIVSLNNDKVKIDNKAITLNQFSHPSKTINLV